MIIVTPSFSKSSNVFHPYENEKPAPVSDSSSLKSVFEELRFRDGLVWTVGLTVEIEDKVPFSNSSGLRWTLPKLQLNSLIS